MAAPTDTATPPANMQTVPPTQGQTAGAAPDPMAQYEIVMERLQDLEIIMRDPRVKMNLQLEELIDKANAATSSVNQQKDAKEQEILKKKGTMGLISSAVGAAVAAVGAFLFTRKNEKHWIKYGVPGGGLALGGILGGVIGSKMGGNPEQSLSDAQKTIIASYNETLGKLCDTYENMVTARVQQMIASGELPGRLDVSGRAPVPSPAPDGNDRAITADDLRQLTGQKPGDGASMPVMMPASSMDMTGMTSGQKPGDGASMPGMMPSSPMDMTGMTSGQKPGDGASMPGMIPASPMDMMSMTSAGQTPTSTAPLPLAGQGVQNMQNMPNANFSDASGEPALPRMGVGAPS